jgi:hypothetical protein
MQVLVYNIRAAAQRNLLDFTIDPDHAQPPESRWRAEFDIRSTASANTYACAPGVIGCCACSPFVFSPPALAVIPVNFTASRLLTF